MNTYFLCQTQYTNVGDLLINKMLVDELSKYGTVFIDCYKKPIEFQSQLLKENSNLVNLYDKYKLSIHGFNPFKLMLFLKKNGVRLFTSSPGPISAKKSKNKFKRNIFVLINYFFSKIGIPIYKIGNCCSTASVLNNEVYQNYVDKYFVRSYNSKKFLMEHNIKNVSYIPDLAFLYYNKVERTEKKKKAAISFRPTGDNVSALISWIKEAVELLTANGYEIYLYHQVKSDSEFMLQVYSQIKDLPNVILQYEQLWYDTLDFYKDKEIVISNRLHALLVGACYGAIPLAVVDANCFVTKIADVFESAFPDDYNDYLQNDFCMTKLQHIINNPSVYSQRMNVLMKENADICATTICDIVRVL